MPPTPYEKRSLYIRIPGPPMHQPRHRSAMRGAHITQYDPAAKDKQSIGQILMAEVKRQGWPVAYDGPVHFHVVAVYVVPKSAKKRTGKPKASKPDWDNVGKFYSDACNGIVLQDDSQIVLASVLKRYADAGEEAHVQLEFVTCDGA